MSKSFDDCWKYRLLHADARVALSEIPSSSIDCIVTDPPYPVISGGHGGKESKSNTLRPSGMLGKNDGKIFTENDIDIDEWIGECFRVLRENTHIYIFTNFANLCHYMDAIEKAGFTLHNLLVWEKNNATPNRWYMKNCEYIIFARKGEAKPINFCGSKTVLQFANVSSKIHPTEKPLDLLRLLIENSTKEEDIVLDPFGESFSTVVAALQCNRRAISFELDETYFQRGHERVLDFCDHPQTLITPKDAPRLSQTQAVILHALEVLPDGYYTVKELASQTDLPSSVVSGCIPSLYSMGLIDKEGNPIKVKLKKEESES